MDKNRKTIKTFKTGSKEDKLEVFTGMNQFVWNMNYPDAEKIPDTLIVWNGNVNGPKAVPGTYYAKIKAGSDSAEVPFEIIPDPNYKTTQAEYEEQFNFLITVRDKFSEVMKALKNIGLLRKQMNEFTGRLGSDCPKEIKSAADDIHKKITAVEEALHQTKAKSSQDVLNFPVRLDDKLSNIYDNAFFGNSAPTKQVKEAYAIIGAQIDEQLNRLKTVMGNDVPQLNKLIHEKTLPVIGLKKD